MSSSPSFGFAICPVFIGRRAALDTLPTIFSPTCALNPRAELIVVGKQVEEAFANVLAHLSQLSFTLFWQCFFDLRLILDQHEFPRHDGNLTFPRVLCALGCLEARHRSRLLHHRPSPEPLRNCALAVEPFVRVSPHAAHEFIASSPRVHMTKPVALADIRVLPAATTQRRTRAVSLSNLPTSPELATSLSIAPPCPPCDREEAHPSTRKGKIIFFSHGSRTAEEVRFRCSAVQSATILLRKRCSSCQSPRGSRTLFGRGL